MRGKNSTHRTSRWGDLRGTVLLAIFAVALVSSSYNAYAKSCLEDVVTAKGTPSRIAEMARANSFFAWKNKARTSHGAAYMKWSDAAERRYICTDLVEGPHRGKWQCTRYARPCRVGSGYDSEDLSPAVAPANEAVAAKKTPTDSNSSPADENTNQTSGTGDNCKPRISAYGALRYGKQAAEQQARVGWKLTVRRDHGTHYEEWEKAQDKSITCRKPPGPRIQCVATASPCL